jgi:hypothetical protein
MRFFEIHQPLITHVYGGPLSGGVFLPIGLCESKDGKNTHLE